MIISIGSGGSADAHTLIGRAGTQALNNGDSSASVVFADAMPSANYGVAVKITNTVDATPIMLQTVITAKSTTGFTATFNAPTDSANYKLEYIVAGNV